ncbi:hypothetical protein SAMD00019534_069630 [Acytostelium subglobosum LB1]|uniref:hypothetical protein n=1 Tax=Acytostelium subglobosum LB1 TaxID=1410327 RepID=UPI0006448612|nr:hypothetical protein SAMD00019534_069630 [Acytostelium subglobosum LB1]GAM23788.1 hypothetical protein SAMD00019534_069630 [Acytostelium subglobosum LB1]|eukprot:XP_012753529.1 hypothetical protein SAMD00019534_069630 [Acytostelium subglobosum LB1]
MDTEFILYTHVIKTVIDSYAPNTFGVFDNAEPCAYNHNERASEAILLKVVYSLSQVCWQWFHFISRHYCSHLALFTDADGFVKAFSSSAGRPLSKTTICDILYPGSCLSANVHLLNSRFSLFQVTNIARLSLLILHGEDIPPLANMISAPNFPRLSTLDIHASHNLCRRVDELTGHLLQHTPACSINLTLFHRFNHGLGTLSDLRRIPCTALVHKYDRVSYMYPSCFYRVPPFIKSLKPSQFTIFDYDEQHTFVPEPHITYGDGDERTHGLNLITDIIDISTLQSVDFGSVSLSMGQISQTIQRLPHLQSITCRLKIDQQFVADIDDNVDVFHQFCVAVATSQSMESMTLIGVRTDGAQPSAMLFSWPDVNSNQLELMESSLLLLLGMPSLTHLNLCRLPFVSAPFLKAMETNTSIVCLFLQESVRQGAVSDMLRANKTITALSLKGNDLGEHAPIASAIATNTSIVHLDLSDCTFSPFGVPFNGERDQVYNALAISNTVQNLQSPFQIGKPNMVSLIRFNNYVWIDNKWSVL